MRLKYLNNLLEYAIFSLTILLVFIVFFEKYLMVPSFVRWLGHWHPLVLHFPIVMIFVTIIQYWRNDKYVAWYLGITTLFALISGLTGFILSIENIIKGSQVLIHQWASLGVTALLVFWWYSYKSINERWLLIRAIQLVLIVLTIFTGHVGGSITHGENFLNFHQTKSEEQQIGRNPSIYLSFVQPILNDKCTKCHNADKSKGKLILSDYLSLAIGGESGPGLDFSDLAKSSLKHHIELPVADEDHMPPSDEKQLTKEELMIINDWILTGASDTLTFAGLHEDSGLYKYIEYKQTSNYQEKYRELPEVTDEKLQKLSSNYISISRLYHNSNAVSIRIYPNSTYDPSQLKPLSAISGNIISLDLSTIAIGSEEIAFIKSCENLEQLNLSNTTLDDSTLGKMGILERLKVFNVFNTAISDISIPILSDFPNLMELFVSGSRLTKEGIEKLMKSDEKLTVFVESSQTKEFSSILPPATITPLKQFFDEPFKIDITHPLAGIDVYYTLDGSLPNTRSAKFTKPVFIENSTLIKFFAVKDGWESSRVDSVQMLLAGQNPDSLSLFFPPDAKYPGRGVYQLTDLIKGPDSFSDSAWMAFREKDFVLRCSWNKDVLLKEIVLSSLIRTDSYLFPPESITIKAGKARSGLKTIYYKKFDGLHDRKNTPEEFYFCSFDSQVVRYVEIIVQPLPKIPLWHQGVGQKGWFFIDEVVFVNSTVNNPIQ